MREAFLLQMNDLDDLLEYELARMLNPIVKAPVPPPRGWPKPRPHLRVWVAGDRPIAPGGAAEDQIEFKAVVVVAEPIPVTAAPTYS